MQNKNKSIIFALFAVLTVLYGINLSITQSITTALVDKPVKISFLVIESPKEDCESCYDASTIIQNIDAAHNIKYKTQNIAYNSPLAEKYIDMYGIKNLPAVVVTGDVKNEKMLPAWKALSGVEKNDGIVIQNLLPNYDVKSKAPQGIVRGVLIKDETCESCFNEGEYIRALQQFGMFISDVALYDVSSPEGSAFVKRYGLTKVPALLVSPEADVYPNFTPSWKTVGTVEKDGWFVFREVQKFNSEYKDLSI